MPDKQSVPKILVASGPVIVEYGGVFLSKHGEDGFWKFPGGKVDDFSGKDIDPLFLENACIKAAKDEIGVTVIPLYPLKPMMIPRPGSSCEWIVLIHYLARRDGLFNLRKDVTGFQKFDIRSILNGSLEGKESFAPNMIPVLEEYMKKIM